MTTTNMLMFFWSFLNKYIYITDLLYIRVYNVFILKYSLSSLNFWLKFY